MEHDSNEVIKRFEKLYLLMNYKEQIGIDYNFSLWKESCLNINASKLLDMYSDKNVDKSFEDFNEIENTLNVNDPSQICYSIKLTENI